MRASVDEPRGDASPSPSSPGAPGGSRGAGLSGPHTDELLRRALEEDLGPGDVTGAASLPAGAHARGTLLAKAPGVVAGLGAFVRTFELLDPGVRVLERTAADGDRVARGQRLLVLEGDARALLAGERTALNLVQRLSGIATRTALFVERAGGRAAILDTRKTTPGLRALEKHAVRCGGGENHRFGLFDQAMVKNNHVDLSGLSPGALVERVRAAGPPGLVVTAEARDLDEALDALSGGADVLLLDNFALPELARVVERLRAEARRAGRRVVLEASGGVTLETIADVAASGVDRVSVGELTHSAPALDLSLRLERAG